MITTEETVQTPAIPARLVREVLNGRPLYYKGCRDVLAGHAKPEDIMWGSDLQSFVVTAIAATIWNSVDRKKYKVASSEAGLHINLRTIGGVKVDGIRLLAVEDIIPMKLEAMATRGVKKDFWNIAELANHFTLTQMLTFYQQKYPNSDPGHVLLAMTYFVDADVEKIDPQCLNEITLPQVKDKLRKLVNEYVKDHVSKR